MAYPSEIRTHVNTVSLSTKDKGPTAPPNKSLKLSGQTVVAPGSSLLFWLMGPLSRLCDCVRVRVQLAGRGLLLEGDPSQGLPLGQQVDHGHVDVEVVGLLKALAAQDAGKLQIGFGLVLGHVVLERGALAALEATHFTPGREKEGTQVGSIFDWQFERKLGSACLKDIVLAVKINSFTKHRITMTFWSVYFLFTLWWKSGG